jgi:hypothetical protein
MNARGRQLTRVALVEVGGEVVLTERHTDALGLRVGLFIFPWTAGLSLVAVQCHQCRETTPEEG